MHDLRQRRLFARLSCDMAVGLDWGKKIPIGSCSVSSMQEFHGSKEKEASLVIVIPKMWTALSLADASFIVGLVIFMFHDKLIDLISKRLYYSYMSIRRVCSLMCTSFLNYPKQHHASTPVPKSQRI